MDAEHERVRRMACVACHTAPPLTGLVITSQDGPSESVAVVRGGGRLDIVPLCSTHAHTAAQHRDEADRIALEHSRPLGIRGLADRFAATQGGYGPHIESCNCHQVGRGIQIAVEKDARCARLQADTALDDHERDALLGGVHREMVREVERRAKAQRRAIRYGCQLGLPDGWLARDGALELVQREMRSRGEPPWDGLADGDREAVAHHIAQRLGGPFIRDPHGEHGLAWTLCEAAGKRFGGWPS